MAKNWTAYEAAKEIYGQNKKNIEEIGSRFPLFTREVAIADCDELLNILKAVPKVTARMVETGLKDGAVEDAETDYSAMTAANLYKECCKRGISSKCKSRKKDFLIELLEKYDAGELDEEETKKEGEKKPVGKKKAEPVEEEDDDWGEDEEEGEKDVYVGKSAMELFKMCKERGIKTKPKQKADVYVKLLKAADEESEQDEDEEDDDEWRI